MRKNCLTKLALLLSGVLAVASCSSDDKSYGNPGEAAVGYYNYLIKGDYEKYVAGMLSCDSVPDDYKKRMAVLVKQFVAKENADNGGIKTVTLDREELMLDGQAANVFLNVTFGNGRVEEVVLPLVKVNDRWRMQ